MSLQYGKKVCCVLLSQYKGDVLAIQTHLRQNISNKNRDFSKDSHGLNANDQKRRHSDFQSFATMTVYQVGSMQGIYKNTTS